MKITEDHLKKWKRHHPKLNFKDQNAQERENDMSTFPTRYVVKGLSGDEDLELRFKEEASLKSFAKLMSQEFSILREFVGIKHSNTFEYLLTPTNRLGNYYDLIGTPLKLIMNFRGNILNVVIEANEDTKLYQLTRLVRSLVMYKPTILKISFNDDTLTTTLLEETNDLLNTILFDIENLYHYGFSAINRNTLERRIPTIRTDSCVNGQVPVIPFKRYIPELIDYYNQAQITGHLQFKFLSFYHIVEYFSDKSVYDIIKNEIRDLIKQPDFYVKADVYIDTIMAKLKGRNDSNTPDKTKIIATMSLFVGIQSIDAFMTGSKTSDHFLNTVTFNCKKPLVLKPLDLSSAERLHQSLAERIYRLRCSIVHSNPDFDEKKAIPFIGTEENLQLLNIEAGLLSEICREIMIKSAHLES